MTSFMFSPCKVSIFFCSDKGNHEKMFIQAGVPKNITGYNCQHNTFSWST